MVDQKQQVELRQAMELFFFAYREFTGGADKVLAERGLGRVHHRILYFVGRDSGSSVNALLETLQVSKQALNAPLRQLVDLGLVLSVTAGHDRRVRSLSLSDAGKALEAQLSGIQMAHLALAFEQAGPVAEAGWRRVMQAMPG